MKINQQEKYLIGVSGGPDSLFLLQKMVDLKPKGLVVCHVNYHFRSDSNLDQEIVTQFCAQHQLPLEIKTINPDFYQDFPGNFEAWARKERYAFFSLIAEQYQIFKLLIAHNQNDLVETYCLQKQRQNLVNYYGLKPVSDYQNLTVIRPLLKMKKSEILANLKREKMSFALDSTNQETKYARNKIRQQLKEADFPNYLAMIKQENQRLATAVNQAQFYVKNNFDGTKLLLTPSLKNFDLKIIQRIIYQFFSTLKQESLIHERKKQTLAEMSKRLKFSGQNFWQIELQEFILLKDFNHLWLLEKKNIRPQTIILENQTDWTKVEFFPNRLNLWKALQKDGENYPYVVTNDFWDYKTKTVWHDKPTNRYLIQHKISYQKRYCQAVIYQKGKKIILNELD